MRITFIPGQCLPFHGKTLDEKPLGGTETGIIRLAEALSERGHEVSVITSLANPPLTNPLYVSSNALQFLTQQDLVIGIRDWRTLLYPIRTKVSCFWTGDAFDQPQTVGLGDRRIIDLIDRFLAVSEWQKATLCKVSGFPLDRTSVIRNGIVTKFFEGEEKRVRKRLIYSSTPYRGLKYLPELFKVIKKKHPEAELHVYSGYDVYGGAATQPKSHLDEFQVLSQELEKAGAQVHGNLKQKDLAREFMKSSILAYPNTFAETSCITAMEAQAAGCVVVSSKLGALPETVGDRGILLEGSPNTLEYSKAFISAIDSLLSDDALFNRLSVQSRKYAMAHFDWAEVAKRVEAFESIAAKESASNH